MVDAGGGLDDTVVRPRASRPSHPPLPDDLDDTIIRLIEPPVIPRASGVPTDALPTDALPTDAPPSVPPPTAPATGAWGMRVRGTDVVVPLDVPVIVGRRPGPVRPSEHPVPRRLVIPADRADVSSRHARIELAGDSLVVTDLGSTNGVVVHWSSGASVRLRSRESCAVLSDAVVVLGDGVEIEFVALPVSPTHSPPEHP